MCLIVDTPSEYFRKLQSPNLFVQILLLRQIENRGLTIVIEVMKYMYSAWPNSHKFYLNVRTFLYIHVFWKRYRHQGGS